MSFVTENASSPDVTEAFLGNPGDMFTLMSLVMERTPRPRVGILIIQAQTAVILLVTERMPAPRVDLGFSHAAGKVHEECLCWKLMSKKCMKVQAYRKECHRRK